MITYEMLIKKLSYDENTGVFKWADKTKNHDVGDVAGSVNQRGYYRIKIYKKNMVAHRLAWLCVYKEWPKNDMEIDHINRIKTDNRIINLRLVSRIQNQNNLGNRCNNKSGVAGVYFDNKDKVYRAFINIYGKKKHLGTFESFDDAKNKRLAFEYEYKNNLGI